MKILPHTVNRLTICLTLSFTQERDGTIVDPLWILSNIMMLTRQRKVFSDQISSRNTIRDAQGRNLIAALTVGYVANINQNLKYTRENTQDRNLTAVVNVGLVFMHLAI